MKRIISILAIAMIAGAAAFAQAPVRTAYFLDGYDFRHQMNPALQSARSYFILPALGYTNVGLQSNMGINTFLYPSDGSLVTFMHESVKYEDFVKKLHNKNTLALDFSTSLISIGAWDKMNGFYTAEINLKGNVTANLPKSLFTLLKSMGGEQSYDLGDLGVRTREYMEVAFGYSRRVSTNLTVGAKFKFLMGLADANLNIDKMSVEMNPNKWNITLQGAMRISSGKMITPKTYGEVGDEDISKKDQIDLGTLTPDFSNFKNDKLKTVIGGYGVALDLGASYEFKSIGLTVSAGLIDLGFISWNNSTYAATHDTSWSFTGFEDISLDSNSENYIANKFGGIFKDLGKDAFSFYREDGKKSHTDALATTLNVGAEYRMPFYKGMSVSALVTTRLQKNTSWAEGRLAVNFAFGNVFALSASYGLSSFGSSFGAALNLHGRGVSFYLATDSIPMKYTAPVSQKVKLGLPLGPLNVGINFGLAFNVSKRRDHDFRTKALNNTVDNFLKDWE